ncbi:ATP-binding protein [Klebsiella michiganensis]|uniref:AAA family ATPase n=1 Tax=Klebsiella michiganensis TaxID=1134687 RepID=UPI002DB6A6FF|nr:AAA family ATPase [Klebsiella michiganensis]MEB8078658.1 ATP-binding protein [Klebsiella michiganensis]
MHLHSYRLKNYRRLQDAHIELADDISIFVGSNNSGKTQRLKRFMRSSWEVGIVLASTILVPHVGNVLMKREISI